MKHTISKLTAGALLTAAACTATAQSSVTISGFLDEGIQFMNHVGNGTQSEVAAFNSILGVSNLGFSGTEDLGGGLATIFRLQAGFNPTNGAQNAGAGTLFSRNAYVGLTGGFGTLTLGKQWDFNDDWLVGSVFKGGYNSGAVFKFSEFDAVSELFNNVIKYTSPKLGGFQAGALYSLGGIAGNSTAGSVYNLGAQYSGGPVFIGATYYEEKSSVAVAGSFNTYKLTTVAGSFDFGIGKARLGYADARIGGPGSFQSIASLPAATKAYVVEPGVDFYVGNALTLSADVLYRKNTELSNKSTVYRFLAVYNLSKRTALVANFARLGNSHGASESLLSSSTNVGGGYVNGSQTGIALGIRHSF
jgi:predicted porin